MNGGSEKEVGKAESTSDIYEQKLKYETNRFLQLYIKNVNSLKEVRAQLRNSEQVKYSQHKQLICLQSEKEKSQHELLLEKAKVSETVRKVQYALHVTNIITEQVIKLEDTFKQSSISKTILGNTCDELEQKFMGYMKKLSKHENIHRKFAELITEFDLVSNNLRTANDCIHHLKENIELEISQKYREIDKLKADQVRDTVNFEILKVEFTKLQDVKETLLHKLKNKEHLCKSKDRLSKAWAIQKYKMKKRIMKLNQVLFIQQRKYAKERNIRWKLQNKCNKLKSSLKDINNLKSNCAVINKRHELQENKSKKLINELEIENLNLQNNINILIQVSENLAATLQNERMEYKSLQSQFNVVEKEIQAFKKKEILYIEGNKEINDNVSQLSLLTHNLMNEVQGFQDDCFIRESDLYYYYHKECENIKQTFQEKISILNNNLQDHQNKLIRKDEELNKLRDSLHQMTTEFAEKSHNYSLEVQQLNQSLNILESKYDLLQAECHNKVVSNEANCLNSDLPQSLYKSNSKQSNSPILKTKKQPKFPLDIFSISESDDSIYSLSPIVERRKARLCRRLKQKRKKKYALNAKGP